MRLLHEGRPRVGRLGDDGAVEVLDHDDPLAALRGEGEVVSRAHERDGLLPPVEAPEIWCAGVTYERSRDARLEEAQTDARDDLPFAAQRGQRVVVIEHLDGAGVPEPSDARPALVQEPHEPPQ